MTLEQLALLRSLAQRPSLQVAPALRAIVDDLTRDGYVARGRDGWTATAEGCVRLERERSSALRPNR
jgi:hypothetical protein